jgi:uncharacterized tellurite resistance protein B-like protein
MLKKLLDRVSEALGPRGQHAPADRESTVRLATAVLMVDVARADMEFSAEEFDRVISLATRHFGLSPEQAAELTNAADETAEDLVSLHEFTQLLHAELSEGEKAEVVRLLWRVAFADGQLDRYEDALVLKISDLLHVSRGLVMRLKHDAAPGAS